MLSVLAIIFGLGVIVFFHEMGHLLMSKALGLDVPRFSIGFPPHILKRKIGTTEYCLGVIPLGGYCKVNLGTTGEQVTDVSWFRRVLVALAGPFANLLLTTLILITIFGIVGWDIDIAPAVVGNVDNSLGLGVGDTVLSVDGYPVADYYAMLNRMYSDTPGTLTVGTVAGRLEIEYSLPVETVPFHALIPVVIGEAMIGFPAYESGIRAGDSITAIDGKPVAIWHDFHSIVTGNTEELTIEFHRNGIIDTAYVTPMEYDGIILTGV
ncbi:MAG: site-2 protease family protein, partial [Candidatus Aegiribacteria sp.]|nr:site-2 protease family protein [Candidatus Aegiribacteria sp.]